MRQGVKVPIDRIEISPEYRERHSQWVELASSDLRNLVSKAGIAKIIVKRSGNKYTVVFGHHLLKAARECGLKEVFVHITVAEADKRSLAEDWILFQSGIEEIVSCGGSLTR